MGGTAFVLALGGLLGYAVLNAGSAAPDPLRDADAAIEGVQVVQAEPARNHKRGPLQFAESPAVGGDHNDRWSNCTGTVYPEQVPEENAAHSLEHGAVWLTYDPALPRQQVETLEGLVENGDYRMLSPFPGLTDKVSAQAWGRQLFVDDAEDPRLEQFIDEYSNGPQTPERGATCGSGVQTTGADPLT